MLRVRHLKIFSFFPEKDKGKVTLTDRFVVIGFYSAETAVEFQSSDPSIELDCHCSLTLFHFKRLLSFQISPATPRALTRFRSIDLFSLSPDTGSSV